MAEETSTFLNKITQIAGGGDASDEARFRFYATSRLMMANAIGAAKTILSRAGAWAEGFNLDK